MSGPARVVVLGGGIAGIAAAWELSKPERRDAVASVTVYQRGWRLGGKGASGRGPNGRVEEHGLHVWLGYYDNAFRMMRECYAELDRPRTDPGAPIQRWDDAFRPAGRVGLGDIHDGGWSHWVADFSSDGRLPGEPAGDAGQNRSPLGPAEFVERSLRLLRDLARSLTAERARTQPTLVISASPCPPAGAQAVDLLRDGELALLVAALEVAALAQTEVTAVGSQWTDPLGRFVTTALDGVVDRLRQRLGEQVGSDTAARRVWHFLDLMRATLRGIVADDLVLRPEGFAAIDDQDYRQWVTRHGAGEATLQSPLVRGVYDLAFGYEEGDDERPRFAAGTGVLLSAKLFFDYRGAIFWKMTAGMGDAVIAPLYEVLVRRGVSFRFFHRVDALRVSSDGCSIAAVELGVQAVLRPGLDRYEPLVDVGGLPCWPSQPRNGLLDRPPAVHAPQDYETVWSTVPERDTCTLHAGEDFDAVVLALPVGVHRSVCRELIGNPRTPEWRAMTEHLATVATQSVQLWLRASEAQLGWAHGDATTSGYGDAFHTHASMSHLLAMEEWPDGERPQSIIYLCHTLPAPEPAPTDDPGHYDPGHYDHEVERVRANADRFLRTGMSIRWPGFRPDLVHDRYVRANVDPSDRYVLSLPGTGRYRLRADASGYKNLVLAGDWIDSGLNAGCIEAAVMSGIQAANAVCRRPLLDGLTGYYLAHRGFTRPARP